MSILTFFTREYDQQPRLLLPNQKELKNRVDIKKRTAILGDFVSR